MAVKVRFVIESIRHNRRDEWTYEGTSDDELVAMTRVLDLVKEFPKLIFRYYKEYYWDEQ